MGEDRAAEAAGAGTGGTSLAVGMGRSRRGCTRVRKMIDGGLGMQQQLLTGVVGPLCKKPRREEQQELSASTATQTRLACDTGHLSSSSYTNSSSSASSCTGGASRTLNYTTVTTSTTTTTTTTTATATVGGGATAEACASTWVYHGHLSPSWRFLLDTVHDVLERSCVVPELFTSFYMSRIIAAGLFFMFAVYANALATVTSSVRNPYAFFLDHNMEPLESPHTLPDLGHDLWSIVLSLWGHNKDHIDDEDLPNRLVLRLMRFTIAFTALHPKRFLIARRFFMISGLLLCMRAISVSVTVLPDASPVCRAQFGSEEEGAYKSQPMFPQAFFKALEFSLAPTSIVTCGDMVFSGHTTSLMMFLCIFKKYCSAKHLQTRVFFRDWMVTERACAWVRRAVYLYVFSAACVIVGSKLHYTLDVLLAVLLTYWTFRTYHDWVRYAKLKKKARLLLWLEADQVIEVDNQAYARAQRKEACWSPRGRRGHRESVSGSGSDVGGGAAKVDPDTAPLS